MNFNGRGGRLYIAASAAGSSTVLLNRSEADKRSEAMYIYEVTVVG